MKQHKYSNAICWILLIPITLLISCGNDHQAFYNIDAVNTKIRKSVGIDILEFKKKTDSKLKNNPDYYKSEIESMSEGGDMDLYNSFGFKTIRDNGKTINKKDVKKNLELMLSSLKNGLELANCNSTETQDSTCYWKNQIIDWVDSENSESRYIDYSELSQDFYNLYRKNYLVEEEFNYIVVFLYVMISIDYIDNIPPPTLNSFLENEYLYFMPRSNIFESRHKAWFLPA